MAEIMNKETPSLTESLATIAEQLRKIIAQLREDRNQAIIEPPQQEIQVSSSAEPSHQLQTHHPEPSIPPRDDRTQINTTMQSMARRHPRERRQDSSIGFGAPVKANMRAGGVTYAVVTSSLLKIIESDLIRYGMILEFVGRFPILVSLSALTEDQLVHVLPDRYLSQNKEKGEKNVLIFDPRGRLSHLNVGLVDKPLVNGGGIDTALPSLPQNSS